MDINRLVKTMEKYLAIASPTGFTKKAIDSLEEDFNSLGLESIRNKKGGLIAKLDGKDNTRARIVTAHIDTLGAMVKYIENDGRIRYQKIGGGSFSSIEGENCTIYSRKGNYRGSIMPDMAATHIYGKAKGNMERNENNMHLRLDERIESREDVLSLGIDIGDFIAMDTRFEWTESGFIKSRYIDNKAAIAIVLEVIRDLKEEGIKPNYRSYFYISNFEESGHGLSYLPEESSEVLAIDIGIVGERQNSREYSVSIAARDNKTPYNYEFRERLVGLCQENSIDYRVDLYNFYSTDSSQAALQGKDIDFASIGPGVSASHHYERTHQESLINTYKLVYEYIRSE